MASTGLSSSVHETDAEAGRADIVVGLTSHNAADTIGAVIGAATQGLASFGGMSVRFVLADAGSTDATRLAAREAAPPGALVELEHQGGPAFATLPYHGQPGRATALRAVLEAAQRLDAKACVVVDAGLPQVRAGWIEQLVSAVADRRVRLRVALLSSARERRRAHQRHRLPDVQGRVRRATAGAGSE